MKILVTGHKGFIGRHLTSMLSLAHTVNGIDIAERVPWGENELGDLVQPGMIDAALDHYQPDVVVHLAAQVGREFGEDDVRHTLRSNAEMTTVLARACGERGVRVLYASTSEVYGDQGGATCYEATPWVLPHNLYGLSKRWGEEALRLYCPVGLQIVRLSMPYGPGAPPGRGRRALDNILWQANTGLRIPIHKGAERSWCWIGDCVRGIRLVLEHGEQAVPINGPRDPRAHPLPPRSDLGIYNVGRDDVPIKMVDLAIKCCELAGADDELIEMIDPPAAQTVVKRLSTAKLRGLGWQPTVELDEGLPQVLEWVKNFDVDGMPIKGNLPFFGGGLMGPPIGPQP